jgi:hypothetical protein
VSKKEKRNKRGGEAYNYYKKGLVTEKANKSFIHGR